MAVVEIGKHLVIDPEIMHGRLTFKGTRVPVSMILAYLAREESVEAVARQWPHIPREALREAIRLACESLHHRYTLELDAADDEARRLWDASLGTTKIKDKAEARVRREVEIAAEFAGS